MATCGSKKAKVWNIKSGQLVHSFPSPPRPLGLEFDGGRLLIASGSNYLATWDLEQDTQPEFVQRSWSDTYPSDTMSPTPPRGSPCALTLSTSHRLLAVAYNGHSIALWDIKEDAYVGNCGKKQSNGETSTHVVTALAFNANPDISLLAVAYLDGDLALLDPFANEQLECFRANCQTLCSSPNGRLLAAGGANGIINIYEFDTLKVLYQVKSSSTYIKQLSFAKDSMLLADIRGAQCTVWEPEALLRDPISEDSSGITSTTVVDTISMVAKAKVTAMVVHHKSEVIFCGRDDGSVLIYEQKTATSLGTLYSHKSPVRLLVWIARRDALLSIDASNRIFLYRVQKKASKEWPMNATVLFKSHLDSEKAITDVLVGDMAARFLVSTHDSDYLFNLNSGKYEEERTQPQASRKWLPHPKSSLHLMCVDNVKVRTYCWSDWSELSSIALSLDNIVAELKSTSLYSIGQKHRIMLNLLDLDKSVDTNEIVLIDVDCLEIGNIISSFSPGKQVERITALDQNMTEEDERKMITTPSLGDLLCLQMTDFDLDVNHVIGISESKKLVFLDQSFWVCSIDLRKSRLETKQHKDSPAITILKHFVIPFDWFAGGRDIAAALAERDLILTRSGELAMIRGGFD